MNILMVAAENDALPGGKVGGIGDVVHAIPVALATAGQQVDVVTPGYQLFSTQPGAKKVGTVDVAFSDSILTVDIYRVVAKVPCDNVCLWAFEHPLFACGGVGKIYCNDGEHRPFASDASKFALFSAAVAKAIIQNTFGQLDVVHLHDWHAAMIAVLRAFDPQYKALKKIHTVYTIHNLALQGVRPFAHDESSLQAWFPTLDYIADEINDPRARHCINPMRAGINLSDKVHAVSPNYANEILRPSDYYQGFFGGEGLEHDLQRAAEDGRLHGILNGCEYPGNKVERLDSIELLVRCEIEQLQWVGKQPQVDSAHFIAQARLTHWLGLLAADNEKRPFIATSVGRVTEQKVLLFTQLINGQTALDHVLDTIGHDGLFIMLGSGDSKLEQFLTEVASRRQNFILLKGYAENLSDYLYSTGDLFLMPSSFEPCGISQMFAMRAGQPCLVHGVGGLSDTVADNKTGYVFTGDNLQGQAEAMIERLQALMQLQCDKPKQWTKVANAAAKARFSWDDTAQRYISDLYQSYRLPGC